MRANWAYLPGYLFVAIAMFLVIGCTKSTSSSSSSTSRSFWNLGRAARYSSLSNTLVNFQAMGFYASAPDGGGSNVTVDQAHALHWEAFAIIDLTNSSLYDGDQVQFQTQNGNYLSAQNGVVDATKTDGGAWETFKLSKLGGSPGSAILMGDQIAIISQAGLYCSAENGGGPGRYMDCYATSVHHWETWTLYLAGNPHCVVDNSEPGLRDQPLVQSGRVRIGSAGKLKFEADPNYLPTLAHEYNITSMDGVGMMSVMQPDQSSAFSPNSGWDFSRPDDLVAFAQSNGMTVRGHNLIASASYNPDWFINGGWSPADLYQIMANRITTSISHFETNYPGVVQSWDVVNEGISDGCNSIWATMGSYGSPLGGDYQDPCLTYIFTAFQLARNAVNAVNPNIKLYYNEYGAEATWEDCSTGGSSNKACKVYQLVRDLKNLGIIDGVGLQSHIWSLGDAPDYGALQHNIHQLGQLGLETQITEMDVGLDGPDVQDSEIQAQGPVYAGVAGACLAEPSCNAIVTWEFMDSISWLMAAAGRYAPLPFDANYNRKPAYYALQAALGGSGVASNNKSLGWNSVTGGKGTVFEIFQCGNSCTSLTANRVLQDDPGLMNYFQWYSDSFDQCWATIGAEGG